MRSVLPLVVGCLVLVSRQATAQAPEPRYPLVLQTPPAIGVNSVASSSDGTIIASASGEGGIRIYDASTGKMLRVIGLAGDRSVAFSPDGKTLAAAGFHMDKLVGLWDVASGKRLKTFAGHTEWECDATVISPDGKLLASSGTDKQVLVWEIETGKLRMQLKDQPTRVSALAFAPDSTTLAGAGGDRVIRVWDCATGRLVRSMPGHRDWICTLAYSSDGKMIASGSCDWGFHRGHDWPRPDSRGAEQSEWRLWGATSGKPLRAVTESGRMLSLAMAPDNKSLACGIGTDVRLYDLTSDAAGKVVTSHSADVTTVAFSPDGTSILSGSHDQTIQRTRVKDRVMEWEAAGVLEQVNSVALSDDASLLVTGSSDHRFARGRIDAKAKGIGAGVVRLWDARTGRLLRGFGNRDEQVMAVAISPDGSRIAAGTGLPNGQGAAHVWNSKTGDLLCSTAGSAKEVLAIAFSRDGNQLATGSADGSLVVTDAATGAVKRSWNGHAGGATSLAFSNDGQHVFCGEGAGGVKVWDAVKGNLNHDYPADGGRWAGFTVDRRLNSISLSRDGGILAACPSSVNNEYVDRVRLWNTSTSALQRDFAAENIHGRPMALSPDGSIIATGGKSVQLWDARTGKKSHQLFGHLKRTQSIAFSRDGRILWCGGSYGSTNAWEVSSGRHLVTLFAFPKDDDRNQDDWLAYHPDGYYEGSAGAEKLLAWRVGDELRTPKTIGEELHRPERIEKALTLTER